MTVPFQAPQPAASDAPLRVSVLGATGSIGTSTLDLLTRAPERYVVEALVANRDAAKLAAAAKATGARLAVVSDPAAYRDLAAALAGSGIEAAAGPDAVVEAAQRPADWVMAAVAGAAGLAPSLAALAPGRKLALANKECLVTAGALFMRRAAEVGATVLPVDSEHNAVFQGLTAGPRDAVEKVTLTASGGPFRTWTKAAIAAATPEQALKHPNWSMGAKVTIDSASLMNKGLELIEAMHLFALDAAQLGVLVHPQSIVHALVQYSDGAVLAQMSVPDMRVPIAHCLAWPGRLNGPVARLDLAALGSLTFERPDLDRFPALRIAMEVLAAGGAAPTVLNAGNEIAVAAFLQRRLTFPGIAGLVAATLDAMSPGNAPETLAEALELDAATRRVAEGLLPEIAAKAS
ncbi:1-deoxy-D-xylulose-5-phosphate reductoisomerase [Blastochloris viridis]|uniref:1-deoxy-D-xylulose 5-phosphate reductoisomerase n=1 Tax=Blastochloris viridis TaxID=1079 RepID=A0A0H5BCE7_BLAVI|nr:1-deoxy-D-xylulose-5-phosphate reductoisomerase [Blastochloris viridis]ALK10198.1 1-deoxy-D-xylulose 5-phosphate reductoisomerase [Blastochloris viridis]BAR99870.1 1-deoxy-D-xylulose 5-phosphate reductoisomerase [Blastochloris viridis]CUU42862.1 1-deoxy-D-xylulose 5-phosphate reductoisomerase [Blastochloris viridis]